MTRFRATGDGFFNDLPGAEANADNASGVLKDTKSGSKLYLYVTNVSSTWTLAGSASQTQARRTFYPQHLVQGSLVIKGQCSSQHEYDKIVEFIEGHHHSMLGLQSGPTGAFGEGISSDRFKGTDPGVNINEGDVGLTFMLMPSILEDRWATASDSSRDPRQPLKKGPYLLNPIHISGIATEIRAGHKRFVHAPEFEIGMKVTYDHSGPLYSDERDVREAMSRYVAGLGTAYKPEKPSAFNDDEVTVEDQILNTISNAVQYGANYWNDLTGFLDSSLDAFGDGG